MTGGEYTQTHVIGNPDALRQIRPGILAPEVMAGYDNLWVNRDNQAVVMHCGDERGLTEPSRQDLLTHYPDIMDPAEGGLSLYGQVPGMVKNTLVVGMKHYGSEFYDQVGGFDGLRGLMQRRITADRGKFVVRGALHSDATKETAAFREAGLPQQENQLFCGHGTAATGCAYCGNLGLASVIAGTDLEMQAGIHSDAEYILGDRYSEFAVNALTEAHAALAERLGGADFVYNRQKYLESGLPTVVLEGTPHEPAHTTGVGFNLDPHMVSAPGKRLYRVDAGPAALLMRRALPEFNLPAEDLVASLIADARPVRSVLASHDVSGDHNPDPNRLPIGVRGGDAAAALEEIERLEIER